MAQQARIENMRFPRSDGRCQPKGFIRGNTNIGPVLEVPVTKHFDRYGTEINIGSMMTDGTQSWVVINRDIDKYVTELALAHTKPIHYDAASTSTEKPVAMSQRREQLKAPSSSLSMSAAPPINQRHWQGHFLRQLS